MLTNTGANVVYLEFSAGALFRLECLGEPITRQSPDACLSALQTHLAKAGYETKAATFVYNGIGSARDVSDSSDTVDGYRLLLEKKGEPRDSSNHFDLMQLVPEGRVYMAALFEEGVPQAPQVRKLPGAKPKHIRSP
jgi:hypothetical protein